MNTYDPKNVPTIHLQRDPAAGPMPSEWPPGPMSSPKEDVERQAWPIDHCAPFQVQERVQGDVRDKMNDVILSPRAATLGGRAPELRTALSKLNNPVSMAAIQIHKNTKEKLDFLLRETSFDTYDEVILALLQ